MKVKVKRMGKIKVLELKDGAKVKDIFKKLNLNPEEFVVRVNKQIYTLDRKIDSDEVELIDVVSGG